jgi:hypothetical protein
MKAEDSLFISQEQFYVTRNGNGIVEARHLKCANDYTYYKVVGLETRYVIRGVSGVKYLPDLIYTTPIKHECFFASSVCTVTRRYVRELDRTYFKYYDDAEEVLLNIIRFIKWSKNIGKIKLKKGQMTAIKLMTQDLVMDVLDTPEAERIRTSQVGLEVKRRSELKPLARDLADELDLLPERD